MRRRPSLSDRNPEGTTGNFGHVTQGSRGTGKEVGEEGGDGETGRGERKSVIRDGKEACEKGGAKGGCAGMRDTVRWLVFDVGRGWE